jgi:hypothetical protein
VSYDFARVVRRSSYFICCSPQKRRIDQIKTYSSLLSPCSKTLQKVTKILALNAALSDKKSYNHIRKAFSILQLKNENIFTAPVAFKKLLV